MQNLKMVAMGFEQLSTASLSGVTSLSPPQGATVALINAEGAAVRWRDDGTDPTATVGMLIPVDLLPFEYWGNLAAIKFITASSSSLLNVSYYRASG